jgi:hypothetical protein
MFERVLLVGGLTFAAIFGLADAAAAQADDPRCYPVVTADCPAGITLDDVTVVPGEPVTINLTGLDPGSQASGVVTSTPVSLAPKTVAADGSVSFTFVVPTDFEPGTHTVTINAVKNSAPITLTATFTVVAPAGAGAIPRTGDDTSLPLGRIAIALVAAGGGAVYLARRRPA